MVTTLDDENMKGLLSGWGLSARPCDSCHVTASLLYCKADAAFLCGACDSKIHSAARGRHERVWMCEVCEQAPASVTCKADAAALCSDCDRDIHAANPLSRRHERVPVVPFVDSAAEAAVRSSAAASTTTSYLFSGDLSGVPAATAAPPKLDDDDNVWLILNPNTKVLMADFLYNDSDLINLSYNCQNLEKIQQNNESNFAFTDSVVPTQSSKGNNLSFSAIPSYENCFDIDFSQPHKHQKLSNQQQQQQQQQLLSSFNYSSMHSVSSSDIGVVPDGGNTNSMSEVSYTFTKSISSATGAGGIVDGGSSAASGAPAGAAAAPGLDREARVLRYREKRKNRKFEKTIRYASRKAYAETRPRIKGRFAKRTEMNDGSDLDSIYGAGSGSTGFMVDHGGYGVVPSF